jgi:hypothetical protein
MKIAIYGDSFSSGHLSKHGKPWHKILQSINPKLEIDNYGVSGSSFWFSYRKYLDTYQDYDKHIFFITSAERFTLHENAINRHIAGWDTISNFVRNGQLPDNNETQQITSLARGVYEFFDPKFFYDVSNCLFKHLHSLNNTNTLFLPCFDHVAVKELNHECSLLNISEIDFKKYGLNTWSMALGDIRNCHMNPENNQILAEKIHQWLYYNIPLILKIEDFVPSKYPKESLFKDFKIPDENEWEKRWQ